MRMDKRTVKRPPQGPKKRADARQIAYLALCEVFEKGAYAAIALGRVLKDHEASDQDRRLATQLLYGTVKAKGTLDWILAKAVKGGLKKVEPKVLNVLRLGAYQIFYMEKIPVSAACNESVDLARRNTHKGAEKFVNGVLRGCARLKGNLPELEAKIEPADDRASQKELELFSLQSFHPLWLVKRWAGQFGFSGMKELCDFDNAAPPLCLRANTLKVTRDELLKKLSGDGAEARASKWSKDGIVVEGTDGIASLLSRYPGEFYVQDESSMLVAEILAPLPGERVLDICSAPGGKATHAAALMQDKGSITACDIHPHKLGLIRENASRLGIDIIKTELNDATVMKKEWEGAFDRVMADVPCSGLGVLRRRAEARWTKTEEGLEGFYQLQEKILENAAACVKKGGYLTYSTCTTEEKENGLAVESFLKRHPEWSRAGFMHPVTGERAEEIALWPPKDGTDGFYITLLHRA